MTTTMCRKIVISVTLNGRTHLKIVDIGCKVEVFFFKDFVLNLTLFEAIMIMFIYTEFFIYFSVWNL